MKKIIIIVLAILTAMPYLAAQETQKRADKEFLFNEGRELYNQQKYSASRKAFEQYIEVADAKSSTYLQAEYYIACNAFELQDDNADDILEAFLAKYPYAPMSDRVRYMLGRLAFDGGNYKQALKYYSQASANSLNPDECRALFFTQGYAYLQQKEYVNALQSFRSADTYGSEYEADGVYYMAYTNYCLGNYEEALTEFEKCTEGKYAEAASYHRLQIYDRMGNSAEAVRVGKELIARFPDSSYNTEAYRILGEASFKEKNYADVIVYMDKYQEGEKKVQRNDMYMLGMAYFYTTDYNNAAESLSKVTTKTDSLSQNAYLHIGYSYVQLKNVGKARMAFQAASVQEFDKKVQEEALYNYVLATYNSGSVFGESINAFNRFLTEFPNSKHTSEVYNLMVSAYMSEKNYAAAYEALQQVKSSSPQILQAKEYILFQLGVSEMVAKRYSSAIDYFTQSLAIKAPKSKATQTYLWRAEAYYQNKQFDLCRADLNTFLTRNGNAKLSEKLKAYYTMGYTYFESEAFPQARTWFLRYAKETNKADNATYVDVLNRIGDTYFHSREFKSATLYYSQAIEADPKATDYSLFQIAFIAGLQKDYTKKISDLERMLRNYPMSKYSDNARYEIGRTYVLQEKYPQAITAYQEVISKYPRNPLARKAALEIGMIYTNMNDANKAIEAYKKVVASYPGSDEAQTALESMQSLYVDNNRVGEYASYRQTLRGKAGSKLQESQEDSLTFVAAQRVYAKGDYSIAIPALENYIKSFCAANSSNCITAFYYLADSYEHQKRLNDALPYYDRLTKIEGNPYMEQALTQAANITYDRKDYQAASGYFEQLQLSTDKADIKGAAQLGTLRCRYQLKQYSLVVDAASLMLRDPALDINRAREARYCRAKAYIALSDANMAEDDLKLVSNDTRFEIGAEAKYLLANLYFEKGNSDQAEREVMDFIKSGSPYQYWIARSFILLSDVAISKQDDFQAKQYLLSLQENYKTNDDIQTMITKRLNEIAKRDTEKVY